MEGPSSANITTSDNKDGTVDVSFLPTALGEYEITVKFNDEHIPGSPFSCQITEGPNLCNASDDHKDQVENEDSPLNV